MVGRMKIYSPSGLVLIDTAIRDESKYTRVLMGEHSVRLRFDAINAVPLPYGSYIEYEGHRWCLYASYSPNREDGIAVYDVAFHAPEAELGNVSHFYLSAGVMEADFDLTATLEQHLVEVRNNLQRHFGAGSNWSVTASGMDAVKAVHIHYEGITLLDALGKIAEAFGCEWWAEGRSIHFGRMPSGEAIEARLGELATRFSASGEGNPLISRLYAFGSTRNIGKGYRRTAGVVSRASEPRLHLPLNTPYIVGAENGIEHTHIFEEVYPRYIGTISSVSNRKSNEDTIYRISDSGILIPKDKLLEGQKLMITFETGVLAGMEFEVGIVHDGYDIVPNETYGQRLPSGELIPKVGDRYIPHGFDISLVGDTYVPNAERELERIAREWLSKNNEDRRDVEIETNPVYTYRNNIKLSLGQRMVLIGAIPTGDKEGRITKIEYELSNPTSITAIIGDARPQGILQRISEEARSGISKAKEVARRGISDVHSFASRGLSDAMRTVGDLEATFGDKLGKAISTSSVRTMQVLVGDPALQFVFIRSLSDGALVTPSISYNANSRKLVVGQGYIAHKTIGIKEPQVVKPNRPITDYLRWSLPAYTTQALDHGDKLMYLYARVSHSISEGSYKVSDEYIAIDGEEGYYHLLIGILSVERDDKNRVFTSLYGYSEILPAHITTGRIVSADGNTYFDLDRGEIGGNIRFRGGKDADTFVADIVGVSAPEKHVTIDALALDPNKYYPVVVSLINFDAGKGVSRYSFTLHRTLSVVYGVPPYARHSAGFSLRVEWEASISGWGINEISRKISDYTLINLKDGENVVSAPAQIIQSSQEYIYVRGGSKYNLVIKWSGNHKVKDRLAIELKPEGHKWSFTHSNGRVEEVVLPVLDSIADRLPKTDIVEAQEYAQAQARQALHTATTEIGSVRAATEQAKRAADEARARANDTYRRSEADGKISEAERKLIAEAEHQADLAKQHATQLDRQRGQMIDDRLASILSNVAQIQGDLQRQIDGQTVAWFGETLPTGRLWTDDDAKHEGDTYTVVAPPGVVITEGNQAQYPHVGKSFRWSGNGWMPIADTDVSRALALASEAKASADGKVTHYSTDVIPVGYRKGDLWTLPKSWNGYKAGSILTAQADEVKGQVNLGHWREANRYTDDTAVKALKVGHRNLVLGSGVISDNAAYRIGAYTMAERWEIGQTYSVRIEAEVYGRPTGPNAGALPVIGIYLDGGNTSMGRATIDSSAQMVDGAYRGVWTLTGQCPENLTRSPSYGDGRRLALYLMGNVAPYVRCVVKNISIVKGDKPPTDWANAPEDIAKDEAIARALDEHRTTEALRNAKRGEADILLANTDMPAGAERNLIAQRLNDENGAYTSLNNEIAKLRAGTSRNAEIVATKRTNWSNTYKALSDAVEAGRKAIARATNAKLEATRQALEDARRVANDAKRIADNAITQAQADGMITEAEARAIAETYRTYRNAVRSEWTLLSKRYEQTYGSPYLVDTSKSGLQVAYGNALASYNALDSRIATILSDGKVIQTEVAPYNSAVADYTAKATALAQALEQADKAIQAELLRRASNEAQDKVEQGKERTTKEIDTRGLDENKYYPLTIKLVEAKGKMTTNRVKVSRSLHTSLGVPSYSAHDQGFSLDLEWVVKGSGWGSRPMDRRVTCYSLLHVKAGEAVVSMPSQIIQMNLEYLYLRGGSVYNVEVYAGNNMEIALHSAGFAQGAHSLPVLDSIANRLPSTDIDDAKRYADGKADEAYKKARQAIDGDYLRKVIKDGSTQIAGGLVNTGLIAMSSFGNAVSAYLNGDTDKLIAFAAGVQNFGTEEEKRMVEIMHSGLVRLGDLILRPNGEIAFIRKATGIDDNRSPFLRIGGVMRPLDELIEASGVVITRSLALDNITDIYSPSTTEINGEKKVLIDNIVLDKPMFKVRVRGTLSANSQAIPEVDTPPSGSMNNLRPNNGIVLGTGSSSIQILIERDGAVEGSIAYMQVASGKHENKTFDTTITLREAGTYRLVLSRSHSYSGPHNVYITSRDIHLKAEKTNDFNEMYFGEGGFVSLFGGDRFVYIGKEGPNVLDVCGRVRIRGEVEMNGPLARGEVREQGSIRWCSGPKANQLGHIRGYSFMDNNKVYTVYHSIGHTQYAVVITPHNTRDAGCVVEKTGTYFKVRFNGTTDERNYAHAFDYVVEGNLTASY